MLTEEELKRDYLRGRLSSRDFMKRVIGLGLALPTLGALTAACGPAAGPEAAAQTLTIAGAKEPLGMDPVQQNDADSTYIQTQVFDPIALLDPNFEVKPHLAESWKTSEDGLTWTYKFRKDVKFHDGSKMTADDVVFTIERILANKYPEGGKWQKINMIEKVTKLDDYTVEFKLKFAYGPFAAALGNMLVVPKAVVEKVGDAEFTKKPVGSGPFKFVEWVPNDHVTLVRNDNYWLVKPKLAKVIVRPISENAVAVANLIAGDVDVINDIVGANLKQLQQAADKGVQILTKPGMSYFWAGFRMLKPPFTDLRFRQAVYYATDFDAVIRAIFPPEIGTRAYGTVPPGLWPQDTEALKAIALKKDSAKAKELFDQLIKEGVMPKDYKILIAPPPDDARIRIAEAMITDLLQLGVGAEMWRGDWAAYTDLLAQKEKNVIYFLGTTPAIPDPDANVRWLFGQEGQHAGYLNIMQYPEYPQWFAELKKAQMSSNRQEREDIYREFVRRMMKLVMHIPLYFKNVVQGKRDYVKDYDLSLNGFQWDLVKPWANVYIDKTKK